MSEAAIDIPRQLLFVECQPGHWSGSRMEPTTLFYAFVSEVGNSIAKVRIKLPRLWFIIRGDSGSSL